MYFIVYTIYLYGKDRKLKPFYKNYMIKYFFEEFILSVKKEINTFAALINRGIHNKDYSVVNIKESQNYFLIVEVLFYFLPILCGTLRPGDVSPLQKVLFISTISCHISKVVKLASLEIEIIISLFQHQS
jgi:hypothetical protein